jgi:hypothetical protein
LDHIDLEQHLVIQQTRYAQTKAQRCKGQDDHQGTKERSNSNALEKVNSVVGNSVIDHCVMDDDRYMSLCFRPVEYCGVCFQTSLPCRGRAEGMEEETSHTQTGSQGGWGAAMGRGGSAVEECVPAAGPSASCSASRRRACALAWPLPPTPPAPAVTSRARMTAVSLRL